MAVTFAHALSTLSSFLGRTANITMSYDDRLKIELDGSKIEIFDWSAYTADQRLEFVEDVLGDAWEERGEGYVKDYEWVSEAFVPFAIMGPGDSVVQQVDRVLFFSLEKGTAACIPVHMADEYNTDVAGRVFASSIDDLLKLLHE